MDIILAILILLGAFQGYRNGFLMTIISFLAIVFGILIAFKLMGWGIVILKEEFEADERILPYLAFALVFVIVVILISLLGRLLKASIDKTFLGSIDAALGAVVGIAKMMFLLSVIIWLAESLTVHFPPKEAENSWLYPILAGFAPKVAALLGYIIPPLKDVFKV